MPASLPADLFIDCPVCHEAQTIKVAFTKGPQTALGHLTLTASMDKEDQDAFIAHVRGCNA